MPVPGQWTWEVEDHPTDPPQHRVHIVNWNAQGQVVARVKMSIPSLGTLGGAIGEAIVAYKKAGAQF